LGSGNWVADNLNNALNTWNDKLGENAAATHAIPFQVQGRRGMKRDGQHPRRGQGYRVGIAGTVGSTGDHLHWEIWEDGVRVDPMGLFE
jgi:hypothetical protein